MLYSKWKSLGIGLAMGIAAMIANVPQAEAHFGHHHSYGGSSGGWYSSGGSSGGWYSSGGSSGGYYSSGGSSGGYYSSGGSSGGYYSSGGSSGGYYGYYSSGGSSGGYYGSSGGYVSYSYAPTYYAPADCCGNSYGTPIYTPAVPATPAPGPATPAPIPAPEKPPASTQLGNSGSALLVVNVPDDAKIYVNGNATTSTGSVRQYVSRNLQSDRSYSYEVKAEMVRNGQIVTQTKTVRLAPGQTLNLNFDKENVAAEPAPSDSKVSESAKATGDKTTLKVHVPNDAKVILAGVETSSRGIDREFVSTKLALGATWENYTVRVIVEQNGKETVKEKTINLIGGETRELNFDFSTTEVAVADR